MKKTKKGRKPLAFEDKKTEVRFFIENKYLVGGLKKSIDNCVKFLKGVEV